MNGEIWARSTSKIVGEVLFVGVGKGGGAIVNEIQKKGYETFYINTAIGDFEGLEQVDENMVFPIPKAKGCDKDRELAFNYIAPYIGDVHTHIMQNYAKYKHFVFVFTTGGGTGSGTTPALAQYFAAQGKGTTLIGVLPAKNESSDAITNSIACIEEVDERCAEFSSILYLDNSCSENKYNVNIQIAQQIDYLMCLSEYQVHTTLPYAKAVDATENLAILSTPKYMGIARVDKPYINKNKPVPQKGPYIINKIESCAEYNTGKACREMAVSISSENEEDFNADELINKYGKPKGDIKLGYNDTEHSFVYLFGLEPCQDIVDRLTIWEDEIKKEEEEQAASSVKLEFKKKDFKPLGQQKQISDPFASKTLGVGKLNKPQQGLFGATTPAKPIAKKLPATNPFTADGKFKK